MGAGILGETRAPANGWFRPWRPRPPGSILGGACALEPRGREADTRGEVPMRLTRPLLPLLALTLATGCATAVQGLPTASGVPYDEMRLTAAHRVLPFGTRVKVTNLANGRSTVVTINDRGPQPPDRIIDLSRRAAFKLGFERQGTTRVRLKVLRH